MRCFKDNVSKAEPGQGDGTDCNSVLRGSTPVGSQSIGTSHSRSMHGSPKPVTVVRLHVSLLTSMAHELVKGWYEYEYCWSDDKVSGVGISDSLLACTLASCLKSSLTLGV